MLSQRTSWFLSSLLNDLPSWGKMVCLSNHHFSCFITFYCMEASYFVYLTPSWLQFFVLYTTLWQSFLFIYLCTLVLLFSPTIVPFYIFSVRVLVTSHTYLKLDFINFISLSVSADTVSKILFQGCFNLHSFDYYREKLSFHTLVSHWYFLFVGISSFILFVR